MRAEPGSDGLSRRGVDCYLIMVSVRGFTPEPPKPEADLVAPPGGNRRHQGTQGNKGTPTHNTTDKPLHSALFSLWQSAVGVACSCNAMWCGISVESLVSNSRTPPHCEGHSCLLSAPQRWGDDGTHYTTDDSTHHTTDSTMGRRWYTPYHRRWYTPYHRLYQTVDMGFAMSLPRGGYRLLSPAREYGGECSCEVRTRSSNNEGALRE